MCAQPVVSPVDMIYDRRFAMLINFRNSSILRWLSATKFYSWQWQWRSLTSVASHVRFSWPEQVFHSRESFLKQISNRSTDRVFSRFSAHCSSINKEGRFYGPQGRVSFLSILSGRSLKFCSSTGYFASVVFARAPMQIKEL